MEVEHLRFRGTVQGVGFRPTVARLARALGLPGWVRNDGEGVLVALGGAAVDRDAFVDRLLRELPPLARVDAVERVTCHDDLGEGFDILTSHASAANTAVAADAATCPPCIEETRDPSSRRYRYPFTNCTHCGPRFTIVERLPYDRASTTMRGFEMCGDCRREYDDETDRRHHAQPIACPRCGPRVRVLRTDGAPVGVASALDAVVDLLRHGAIVAIKGLGGYQLCCDATREDAVARLRMRKHRPHRPLALMARDVAQIERFCTVSAVERHALESPAGPIVLLAADGPEAVAPSVAPDQRRLGFLLPSTPLHHVLLSELEGPVVCTSGNVTGEPQCIDDDDARHRLGAIADAFLVHDRPIAHRVDDSVVRELDGAIRSVRRARGFAPTPLALHPSFAAAPPLTALGGHLKSTFCLLRDGRAMLSPHVGDLDDPRTVADHANLLDSLTTLFEHAPRRVVVDAHPGYRTRELVPVGLPRVEVAHHHAHAAACMAEHGLPVDADPVLAIVLDGLGMGDDGALWGGELLAVDFRRCTRLAALPDVALLGGDRAAREPWRSALAHLVAALGWEGLERTDHPTVRSLLDRRDPLVELALSRAPRASSAGRLFDAVAALLGLSADGVTYEAQAAMALEALAVGEPDEAYPIGRVDGEVPRFDLAPMWTALLSDLGSVTPRRIASRFHGGLAFALAREAATIRRARPELVTIVLSGGVWQNAVLLERALRHLRADGWEVLLHRQVPPNDGGIALGQAAVAAARALPRSRP
ncbi:MAG: carbamoyltransferase HypF [Alphaproteobacteria bacterium]|nr:carbamoyltransferase HypF [Alphaproteobacteria bacterium]MCB9696926.1 carbamoyltransferase HypF [Alphaproteobacteria bacterium]